MKEIHPEAYAAQIELARERSLADDIAPWRIEDVAAGRAAYRWLASVKIKERTKLVDDIADISLDLASGPRPARVYRPASDADLPTIVYVHGGGYVIGGLDEFDGEAQRLAASLPANIISITYRLAPEHPFPAAIDDVKEAIETVRAGGAGFVPERLGALGVSAGAGAITAATRRMISAGEAPPAFLVLLSPWLDLTLTSPSAALYCTGYGQECKQLEDFRTLYVPEGVDFDHPELSPARYPIPEGWPHTIMLAAERDPLADDAALMARRLEEAGVAYDLRYMRGMLHGSHTWFQHMPALKPELDWLDCRIRQQMN